MKKYGLIVAGFMFLIVALAGSPALAADKTGFVSVKDVVFSTAMGKKATEDFNKARTNLRDKDSELKKLNEELEKQRPPLIKEEVYKEKEVAFNKKKRDFQILVKDTEEEFQVKEQELYQKLVPDIMALVRTIGEKEKYTMIVDVSAIPLAYWSKESDITKRVIDEFNKSYKPKK
jgi:outer membrane protein